MSALRAATGESSWFTVLFKKVPNMITPITPPVMATPLTSQFPGPLLDGMVLD